MSRSNLGTAFRLTDEYQNAQGGAAILQLKVDFRDDIIRVSQEAAQHGCITGTFGQNVRNRIGPNMRMIPAIPNNGLPAPSGPTLQDFAYGMVDGRDLLSWSLLSRSRVSAGGNSMGNMGVETVGPLGHRGDGIIVEFRNFGYQPNSNEWSRWAESLMRWVVQVNTPNIAHPQINWQAGQVLPGAPPMPAPSSLSPHGVLAVGALATSLALSYFF